MTQQVLTLEANVTIVTRDARDERILSIQRHHNKIPNSGLNLLRDLLNDKSGAGASVGQSPGSGYFAIGTGSTAAASGDTTLGTEIFRDVVTSSSATAQKLTITFSLGTGQANGYALREAGILNASSGGTLFARAVHSVINKTSAITVTYTWEITFSSAN